jgi:hypothetical protein
MHSFLRVGGILNVILAFCSASACTAQTIHYYSARMAGMTSTMHEKQLEGMLVDLDPAGVFKIDRNEGTLEWKSIVPMDRFQFEHRIGRFGLSLLSYEERIGNSDPMPHTERIQRLADMPLYMDTGDPVRDNARYDAYKAAWIATHPEEYLELTRPTNVEPLIDND